ncbi:hypothetical protein [Bacillus badius]|uniref:hypothetical protein n=1 Tax=Bacillus badius TaxID=1455 RepID=UPI0005973131|nr:hypothetical protein [Bacillus badius]KIL74337.1 hypothetical protein SD78_1406 [Bacillus badius]
MDNPEINKEIKPKISFLKSKLFLSILALLVIGLGVGVYFVREYSIEKKEEEYLSNLNDTAEEIKDGYTLARPLASLYSEVWGVTIKNDLYIKNLASYLGVDTPTMLGYTDESKLGNHIRLGKYIERGDFETGLQTIYNLKSNDGTIENIDAAKDEIVENMKKIKEPPNKYKDIYDETLSYYQTYEEFINLAKQPSGSYITYTKDIRELSSELESQYEKIQVSMP